MGNTGLKKIFTSFLRFSAATSSCFRRNQFSPRRCVPREAEIGASTLGHPEAGSPEAGTAGTAPLPERARALRPRPGACALRVSLARRGGRARASRRGIGTRKGSGSGDRRSCRRHAPVHCPARRGRSLGKGSLPPPAGRRRGRGTAGRPRRDVGKGGLGLGRCLESKIADPQSRLLCRDGVISSVLLAASTRSVVSRDGCSLSLSNVPSLGAFQTRLDGTEQPNL